MIAEAPYLLAAEGERVILSASVLAEAECPLIGTVKENGVIDPEMIPACTNCVDPGSRGSRRRPVGSSPRCDRTSALLREGTEAY